MDGLVECNAFLGGKKLVPREKLRFRPSVYGFVIQGSRLLLVDSLCTGKCFLPGGGVELGERLEAALQRELREETEVEATVGPRVGCEQDFFSYDPAGADVPFPVAQASRIGYTEEVTKRGGERARR